MLIDGAQWVVTAVRRIGTGQVTMFSGQGQGAGRGSDRSGLTIAGRFIVERPLDLAAFPATVTITSLFNEAGGIGETVAGLPLILIADRRNNEQVAYFKSAAGVLPIAKLALGSRGRGEFTSRLNVSGATSLRADRCPDTGLTTTFVIQDGVHPDVSVSTQQRWLCFGTGKQYLRSRR
jgi:hypothetical protein